MLLRSDSILFVVQVKRSGLASPVYMSAKQLRRWVSLFRQKLPDSIEIVPLLVVPYMGEIGQGICAEEGLAWLDLSGNADIKTTALRVFIRGHKNKFRRRGRKATPFAPQASRVARQFLISQHPCFTQKQLVHLTGLDQGFVSRTLQKLEEEKFLKRKDRTYAATNRSLLLDAWYEAYEFTRHRIIKGHIPTRSSESLLSSLSGVFHNEGIIVAATGLAGAWLLTHFVSFRLVTLYLEDQPSSQLLTKLGFREDDKGANVWLVIPNDQGVFSGREDRDGVACAHPVQVYLDLKSHPERSREAADHLKAKYLFGDTHA